MPDLDDATRTRLEQAVRGTWPLVTLDRGDVLALLGAFDALLAARDQAVERTERLHAHMKALEIDLEHARATQAQAAPVLAAAEAWALRDTLVYHAWESESIALHAALAAWRAARGETQTLPARPGPGAA